MFAALIGPLLEALAAAGAAEGAAAGAEGAAAGESASGGETAKMAKRMSKGDKQADEFNKLFKDHPANKPTEAPEGDSSPLEKMMKDYKADPIGESTNYMNKATRDIESGKSIGQGILDGMKKLDPTGISSFAIAANDLAFAGATRGVKTASQVVNDDYMGMAGQILPDAQMKFVKALDDLTNEIVNRGRYLAKFNGELAVAGANADIRRLNSEMYEAQTVGHNYSRVTEEQSKLENKLRDAFAPVKDAIANVLAEILAKINFLIDLLPVKEALQFIAEIGNFIAAMVSLDPERLTDAIMQMPERMFKAFFAPGGLKPDANQIIKDTMDEMRRQGGGQPAVGPRGGDNGFRIPLVRGA